MIPLLLLPGNMCGPELWQPLRATLGERAAIDVRLDRAGITEMAEQALAAAPPRFVPAGFSMGAIVALEVARLAPDRVVGLVLLDCNPAADMPERAAVRPRQQDDVRAGGLARVVADELKPNYLAAANAGDQALLADLMDMAMALGPEVFVAQSEALRTRADLRPVLRDLDCPIFLACGAEDRLCPPEWHEASRAACADAELHVIRGAGHMLPLERPAALAGALLPWLEALDRLP